MSDRLTFSIPGEPKGKGRPRAVAALKTNDDGEPEAFVRMVTPKDTRVAESHVRAAFKKAHPDHQPWTGAVQINFTAVFKTPVSFNRKLREACERGEVYAIKKPDKDNIEKLIVDALNGHAWHDDSQVMGGGVKRYGSVPRIDVSLKVLPSPDGAVTPGQKRRERAQQAELPLDANRGLSAVATKSVKPPPDLGAWNPRQRALIEAAMARDAKAAAARAKR